MLKSPRAKNLLLTGRPGVGKTTVVRKVVEQLGVEACGFFTEEIREGPHRTGFKIVTTDGREAILAHIRTPSSHRVGRYGVSMEGMQHVAVPTLRKALESAAVVVIDEIAKMELSSPEFKDVVLRCLDSSRPVLAVIQMTDQPFVNRIRARGDVEVIEVTPSNRDLVPRQAVTMLQTWLRRKAISRPE